MVRWFGMVLALGVAVIAEPSWAQGNVGGTIGKKDKTVTGGNEQPASKSSRRTRTMAAGPRTDGCSRIVGSWTWFFSSNVFAADRSVRNSGGNTGTWSCAGSALTIRWINGVVDRGTLSTDGSSLSMTSSIGVSFQARRQ